SPMLALLARAGERVPADRGHQATRLPADLMGAARPARGEPRAGLGRGGPPVAGPGAGPGAGGGGLARAGRLRFRVAKVVVPEELVPDRPPALPETAMRFPWSDSRGDSENPLQHMLEMRPVPGFESPTAWLRLRVPLVAGETNSPLVRVAFVS